jgi:hypothetical protein
MRPASLLHGVTPNATAPTRRPSRPTAPRTSRCGRSHTTRAEPGGHNPPTRTPRQAGTTDGAHLDIQRNHSEHPLLPAPSSSRRGADLWSIQAGATVDLFRITERRGGGDLRRVGVCPMSWADDGPMVTVVVRCDLVIGGPDVAPMRPNGPEARNRLHGRQSCSPSGEGVRSSLTTRCYSRLGDSHLLGDGQQRPGDPIGVDQLMQMRSGELLHDPARPARLTASSSKGGPNTR